MTDFEKLKNKYPIGTKLNYKSKIIYHNLPYYTQADLILYKETYLSCEVLDDNYCKVSRLFEAYDIVQGYLFDGEKWMLMSTDCNGWFSIPEEDKDV